MVVVHDSRAPAEVVQDGGAPAEAEARNGGSYGGSAAVASAGGEARRRRARPRRQLRCAAAARYAAHPRSLRPRAEAWPAGGAGAAVAIHGGRRLPAAAFEARRGSCF